MESLIVFFSINMLLFSALEDLRTYHIPNCLTFSTMFIGLIMLFFYPKPFSELCMISLGFLALFFMGFCHMMGMGDVKMYMAILLLNGFYTTLLTLLTSCVVLIVYACIKHFDEVKAATKNTFFQQKITVNKKYPFAGFTFFGYAIVILRIPVGILG